MINPWPTLPEQAPYVLPDELPLLQRFNAICKDPEHQIKTHIFPEPFVGSIDAPVLFLGLNPGYSPTDDDWHSRADFSNAIRANLLHQPSAYPFYFLDPAFSESGGGRWWRNKLKQPLLAVGDTKLAHNIACVELFPYHSIRYRAIPSRICDGLLHSQHYSVWLTRNALARGAHIVVMRSYKQWLAQLPELADAPKVWRLNNPQNVTVSPKNLTSYDLIMDAIRLGK